MSGFARCSCLHQEKAADEATFSGIAGYDIRRQLDVNGPF
jgi:hypothetical protein